MKFIAILVLTLIFCPQAHSEADSKDLFLWAARDLNVQKLKELVDAGLDTKEFIQEAVNYATHSSSFNPGPIRYCNGFPKDGHSTMKYLFSLGAQVNHRDKWGRTPLMNAVDGSKNPEIIKFLLENGADPNIRDYDGRTALSYVSHGWLCYGETNEYNIDQLVKYGAGINIESPRGDTPLMSDHLNIVSTSNYLHVSTMQKLVTLGADLHHRNHEGKSVIFFIAEFFNLYGTDYYHDEEQAQAQGLVEYAFSRCESYARRDNFGKRPIDYITSRYTKNLFEKIYQDSLKHSKCRKSSQFRYKI